MRRQKSTPADALIHIGALAATLQTTAKTIRLYERLGLLARPVRTSSGYRLYDREAIGQARLVLGLRRIGLSIDEVSRLLRPGARSALRRRVASLIDEKLQEMDLALGVMQGRREDLAARQMALMTGAQRERGECLCDVLSIECYCGWGPARTGA
jgi:DNA-binding transcriptional MerR regulator